MKNGKHDFGFGKMNMPILEGCGFKSQAAPGYRVGFPVKSHHLAAVSCSYDGYYLAGFGFGLGVMGSWAAYMGVRHVLWCYDIFHHTYEKKAHFWE